MDFVNRKVELQALRKLYAAPGFQFVPVYGRRRVGKTRLIREFIQGKPAIYFLADSVPDPEQLRRLGQLAGEQFRDRILAENGFRDWSQCFAYLAERAPERLVLVIDEFPYLAYSNPAISSIFQRGIDETLRRTSLFLILMGSSIGMMEREVLHYKAPLYGRRTASLEVSEMEIGALADFFPRLSFADRVRLFSVFGAIPAYLEKVNPRQDLLETIRDLVLDPTSYLHNEVDFILLEELREPRNYFVILRAIAQGKHRISEIVNDTAMEKSHVSRYLDTLVRLGFVRRDIPVTEEIPEKSKKGLYKIRDRFFTFWFRYVFPNKSRLEIGRDEAVLKIIRAGFELHVSQAFEEACRARCRDLMRDGRMSFTRIGRWWSKDAEIDLVALDEDADTAWFGECKWSNKKVGENLLQGLRAKAAQVDWRRERRQERFLLFSKSGFTEQVIARAAKEGVVLVGPGGTVEW